MQGSFKMHEWRIEPREYARQEDRRGRRHAYESLDPVRTALVVIDMVPFFAEANPYVRGIVPNICRIAEALRTAGGLVAWVLPANEAPLGSVSSEFYGPTVSEVFASAGGDGPLRSRLWHALDVRPDDSVMEKTAYSAFFPGHSVLPGLLAKRGIDTVIITGALTNVCCESSARDAATTGLRVLMVADANAARRDQDHNAALYTIYRSFGDVRTTDEVLDLIRKRTGPAQPAR
ncbi:isochorismatase family cysteine hydrolase [Streptomyces sp. NRRL B-3648]|uniref:isochorismatase family cysteine hydrolase n=1 Tax=Streptomyces sp. NRRL B-3648 TaxID=1519493 RepID=UPI0006AEF634|nr:isochorismatase family cysteine hydrolase [Streptomyces sp. NRRL B-3648]KOX11462.1 isochorismatase [Streptomyces sp. NRRL B-3648]